MTLKQFHAPTSPRGKSWATSTRLSAELPPCDFANPIPACAKNSGGYDLDALYELWEERREIGALGEVLAECGFPKITGRLIGTLLRGRIIWRKVVTVSAREEDLRLSFHAIGMMRGSP